MSPLNTGGASLAAGSAAGPGVSGPNIPNYLVQAVLLTLICFVLSPFTPFFPGRHHGDRSDRPWGAGQRQGGGGNYVEVGDSRRMARVWAWITFAFVVIELLILAAFVLLFILTLVAGASA